MNIIGIEIIQKQYTVYHNAKQTIMNILDNIHKMHNRQFGEVKSESLLITHHQNLYFGGKNKKNLEPAVGRSRQQSLSILWNAKCSQVNWDLHNPHWWRQPMATVASSKSPPERSISMTNHDVISKFLRMDFVLFQHPQITVNSTILFFHLTIHIHITL